eukprot:3266208-Rhodomonas_salina.1
MVAQGCGRTGHPCSNCNASSQVSASSRVMRCAVLTLRAPELKASCAKSYDPRPFTSDRPICLCAR